MPLPLRMGRRRSSTTRLSRYGPSGQLADLYAAEGGRDVAFQQPCVELDRLRSEVWALLDLDCRVLAERDPSPLRVGPLAGDELSLDQRKRPLGIALLRVRCRTGSHPTVET